MVPEACCVVEHSGRFDFFMLDSSRAELGGQMEAKKWQWPIKRAWGEVFLKIPPQQYSVKFIFNACYIKY